MKVLVRCPQGHTFRCAEEHLGKAVRCPHAGCGEKFTLCAFDPACPGCGATLAPEAAICVNCGLQVESGERLDTSIEAGSAAGPAAVPQLDADPLCNDVHEAVRRMESRSAGLARGVAVLGVSVVAFFMLGLIRFDFVYLGLLAMIIIIHELGHLAAMRLFGYTNLRVFLLPLFGGAASGRKANAPGWQRAVVSLAGPLPGMVIGYVLLVAAVYRDSNQLGAAAMLFIALNALNLLPLFPLDGGRFLNEVLFCRSHLLATVFQVLTALAILVLGLLIGAWIIAGFGGLILLGAAGGARINSMAARLRTEAPATGAQPAAIPPRLTVRIVEELRDKPGFTNAPAIARAAFQVWQRMNTRPPRWAATIGLLLVYAVAWLSVPVVPFTIVVLVAAGAMPVPSSGAAGEFFAGVEAGLRGSTVLHYAASTGDVEAVRKLIAAGHAVDAADEAGITPLMEAAASGNAATVKLLLDAGADTGARDADGLTALDYAMQRQDDPQKKAVVNLLRPPD